MDKVYLKKNSSFSEVNGFFIKTNGVWVENSDLTQVFENNKVYILRNE